MIRAPGCQACGHQCDVLGVGDHHTFARASLELVQAVDDWERHDTPETRHAVRLARSRVKLASERVA